MARLASTFTKPIISGPRFNMKMQSSALSQMSMPAMMVTAISHHQIHNLVKFLTNGQVTEQGNADALTQGLLSLAALQLPLVNLSSQICTHTKR